MELSSYLDLGGCYIKVGTLDIDGETSFKYSEEYLSWANAYPIFGCLPLTREMHKGVPVQAAFDALTPEGLTRMGLANAFRVSEAEYGKLLARLTDETIGALVFTTDGRTPGEYERYQALDSAFLDEFAEAPRSVSQNLMGKARLSLAGEMAKIGVYQDSATGKWYLPLGTAPSTHIIKIATGDFENQVLNEALCLLAARNLDIEIAETELMRAANGKVLISSKRFDREIATGACKVDGLDRPARLHMEDFCQALGIPSVFKYEPSEATYLELMSHALAQRSSNAFGERTILLEQVYFRHLIGDCDGHLKNYSIYYPSFGDGMISPLYDTNCTTIYKALSREEGIRLNESRVIDQVRPIDLVKASKRMGIPDDIAKGILANLVDGIAGSMEAARDALVHLGFTEANDVANLINNDLGERTEIASNACESWGRYSAEIADQKRLRTAISKTQTELHDMARSPIYSPREYGSMAQDAIDAMDLKPRSHDDGLVR